MSETKKRKVHPPEFKAKVGLEAVRGFPLLRHRVRSKVKTGAAPSSYS